MTDSTGAITASTTFDAYGNKIGSTGKSTTPRVCSPACFMLRNIKANVAVNSVARKMAKPVWAETIRSGEAVRVYRRRGERRGTLIGGMLIFGASAAGLAHFLATHQEGLEKALLLVSVLVLVYGVLVVGFVFVAHRVGIETSQRGVRSISFTRNAFVEWSKIETFVVAPYTPLSACVVAECRDGSKVLLNGVATWASRRRTLMPYCDALIRELKEHGADKAEQ